MAASQKLGLKLWKLIEFPKFSEFLSVYIVLLQSCPSDNSVGSSLRIVFRFLVDKASNLELKIVDVVLLFFYSWDKFLDAATGFCYIILLDLFAVEQSCFLSDF